MSIENTNKYTYCGYRTGERGITPLYVIEKIILNNEENFISEVNDSLEAYDWGYDSYGEKIEEEKFITSWNDFCEKLPKILEKYKEFYTMVDERLYFAKIDNMLDGI